MPAANALAAGYWNMPPAHHTVRQHTLSGRSHLPAVLEAATEKEEQLAPHHGV
jgi:hypothetical protein